MSTEPGTIGWIDLTIPDAAAIRGFYEQVVGWEHEAFDMGGYSDYVMKAPGRDGIAGICHARGVNSGVPACWLIYINVANLESSIAAAARLGGSVVQCPRSMGGGRMCVIRDPSGAACALFEPAKGG